MLHRYETTKEPDGSFIIHDVPIFAEISRDVEMGDSIQTLKYDEAWINTAVNEAIRREKEQHHKPVLFVEHNRDGKPIREIAGFLSNQRAHTIQYDGKPTRTVYADLVITLPEIFEEIKRGQFPGISVEIKDSQENNPQTFTAAALLNSEPPALKFDPLLVKEPKNATERPKSFMEARKTGATFEVVCFSEFPNVVRKFAEEAISEKESQYLVQAEEYLDNINEYLRDIHKGAFDSYGKLADAINHYNEAKEWLDVYQIGEEFPSLANIKIDETVLELMEGLDKLKESIIISLEGILVNNKEGYQAYKISPNKEKLTLDDFTISPQNALDALYGHKEHFYRLKNELEKSFNKVNQFFEEVQDVISDLIAQDDLSSFYVLYNKYSKDPDFYKLYSPITKKEYELYFKLLNIESNASAFQKNQKYLESQLKQITESLPKKLKKNNIKKQFFSEQKLLDSEIGMEREDMPQFKGKDFDKLLKDLKKEGIKTVEGEISASLLKPTQEYLDTEKVKAIQKEGKKLKPILISSDLFILDGHHHWASVGDGMISVVKIDLPIKELLEKTKDEEFGEKENKSLPYDIDKLENLVLEYEDRYRQFYYDFNNWFKSVYAKKRYKDRLLQSKDGDDDLELELNTRRKLIDPFELIKKINKILAKYNDKIDYYSVVSLPNTKGGIYGGMNLIDPESFQARVFKNTPKWEEHKHEFAEVDELISDIDDVLEFAEGNKSNLQHAEKSRDKIREMIEEYNSGNQNVIYRLADEIKTYEHLRNEVYEDITKGELFPESLGDEEYKIGEVDLLDILKTEFDLPEVNTEMMKVLKEAIDVSGLQEKVIKETDSAIKELKEGLVFDPIKDNNGNVFEITKENVNERQFIDIYKLRLGKEKLLKILDSESIRLKNNDHDEYIHSSLVQRILRELEQAGSDLNRGDDISFKWKLEDIIGKWGQYLSPELKEIGNLDLNNNKTFSSLFDDKEAINFEKNRLQELEEKKEKLIDSVKEIQSLVNENEFKEAMAINHKLPYPVRYFTLFDSNNNTTTASQLIYPIEVALAKITSYSSEIPKTLSFSETPSETQIFAEKKEVTEEDLLAQIAQLDAKAEKAEDKREMNRLYKEANMMEEKLRQMRLAKDKKFAESEESLKAKLARTKDPVEKEILQKKLDVIIRRNSSDWDRLNSLKKEMWTYDNLDGKGIYNTRNIIDEVVKIRDNLGLYQYDATKYFYHPEFITDSRLSEQSFSEEKLPLQKRTLNDLAQTISDNWTSLKGNLASSKKFNWLVNKVNEQMSNIDPKTKKHAGGEVNISPDVIASWLRSIPFDQIIELGRTIGFAEDFFGKKFTKKEMIDRGSDGYLNHAKLLRIPINKLDGMEPQPSNPDTIDGKYYKGRKIENPIEVVYDAGNDKYMVLEGNHRIAQAKANGDKTIIAYVEPDNGNYGSKNFSETTPDFDLAKVPEQRGFMSLQNTIRSSIPSKEDRYKKSITTPLESKIKALKREQEKAHLDGDFNKWFELKKQIKDSESRLENILKVDNPMKLTNDWLKRQYTPEELERFKQAEEESSRFSEYAEIVNKIFENDKLQFDNPSEECEQVESSLLDQLEALVALNGDELKYVDDGDWKCAIVINGINFAEGTPILSNDNYFNVAVLKMALRNKNEKEAIEALSDLIHRIPESVVYRVLPKSYEKEIKRLMPQAREAKFETYDKFDFAESKEEIQAKLDRTSDPVEREVLQKKLNRENEKSGDVLNYPLYLADLDFKLHKLALKIKESEENRKYKSATRNYNDFIQVFNNGNDIRLRNGLQQTTLHDYSLVPYSNRKTFYLSVKEALEGRPILSTPDAKLKYERDNRQKKNQNFAESDKLDPRRMLQTIVVSKTIAKDVAEAEEIARKHGRVDDLIETASSWRFRQRNAKEFDPDSYKTKKDEGVALVYATLKDEEEFAEEPEFAKVDKDDTVGYGDKTEFNVPIDERDAPSAQAIAELGLVTDKQKKEYAGKRKSSRVSNEFLKEQLKDLPRRDPSSIPISYSLEDRQFDAPEGLPKYVEARKEIYQYDGNKWESPSKNFMKPQALASSLVSNEAQPIGEEMIKVPKERLKFAEKKFKTKTKELLDQFVKEKDPKKEAMLFEKLKESQERGYVFTESEEELKKKLSYEPDNDELKRKLLNVQNRETDWVGELKSIKEKALSLLQNPAHVLDIIPDENTAKKKEKWLKEINSEIEKANKIRESHRLPLIDTSDRLYSQIIRIANDTEGFAEDLVLTRIEEPVPQNKLSPKEKADLRQKKKELARDSDSNKKVRNIVNYGDVKSEEFDEQLNYEEYLPDEVITREGENLVMYKFNTEEDGYQIKAIISPKGESLPIEEDEEAIFSLDMLVDPRPVYGTKYIDSQQDFGLLSLIEKVSPAPFFYNKMIKPHARLLGADPDSEWENEMERRENRKFAESEEELKKRLERDPSDEDAQRDLMKLRNRNGDNIKRLYELNEVWEKIPFPKKGLKIPKKWLPVVEMIIHESNLIRKSMGLKNLAYSPIDDIEESKFSETSTHLKETALNAIQDTDELTQQNRQLFRYYLNQFIDEQETNDPLQIDVALTKVLSPDLISSYKNEINEVYKDRFPKGLKSNYKKEN